MNMLERHIVEVHGITDVTGTINKDMLTNETWIEADVTVSCYGVTSREKHITTIDAWEHELAQGWYFE